MNFRPDPDPFRRPPREHRWWPAALYASAFVTALATRWPWVRVKFESLFGVHVSLPGWQSSVGFTCLMTSLLVAVMAMAENGTALSRQAVRPGSLLVTAIALACVAFALVQGPPGIRGVSGAWTPWFWVAGTSLAVLGTVCLLRWRAATLHRS